MEGAKAAVGSVELPTGVKMGDVVHRSVKFRELAGPEEDVLASGMSAGQKMAQVMANCTLELGTITSPAEIRKAMDKLVVTDRWFYLVHLRILSLGASYHFETTCPHCSALDKITYDLRTVQVQNPPNAGELFGEVTLPRTGSRVRWKVADGETEAKMEKMASGGREASVALFARVTEVNDRPASLSDIIQLPLADRSALRKAMDEKEGEFDDTFERSCGKCGQTYQGQLQLDGKTFFSL
jgi:hypothetical protein